METIDLNLIPGETPPVCHVSQFDVGREIKVNLYDGANVYTLAGDETLVLDVRKPDTCVVTESLTNTSSTFVKVVTTQQMTACPGQNICEIKITKGSQIIGTLNFIMEVEEDPLNNGVTSQSAIHDLQTQVEDIVHGLVGGGGLNAINILLSFTTYTSSEVPVEA